jgi:hypothetical protein
MSPDQIQSAEDLHANNDEDDAPAREEGKTK